MIKLHGIGSADQEDLLLMQSHDPLDSGTLPSPGDIHPFDLTGILLWVNKSHELL
jgi:hypothetical protein